MRSFRRLDPSYFITRPSTSTTDTRLVEDLDAGRVLLDVARHLEIHQLRAQDHLVSWLERSGSAGARDHRVLRCRWRNSYGGLAGAQSFSRLYPVPNMDHCSGGATTDRFDLLTPLAQWVENGTAPGPSRCGQHAARTSMPRLISCGVLRYGCVGNAPTTRSRPLCPYPQEARFTGSTTMVQRCTGGDKSGGSRQRFELHLHYAVAPVFAVSRRRDSTCRAVGVDAIVRAGPSAQPSGQSGVRVDCQVTICHWPPLLAQTSVKRTPKLLGRPCDMTLILHDPVSTTVSPRSWALTSDGTTEV